MSADSMSRGDSVVMLADLIWHSAAFQSDEHFTAAVVDGRPRLSGTAVMPISGRPAHIAYEVVTDTDWRTRSAVAFIVSGAAQHRIEVVVDDAGRWMRNGESMPGLTGCVDIDLGWTPATNTLQIRRLGLDVGDETTIDVAWLRFPELTLERTPQTYRRLTPTSWQYRSGDFSAVLDVDEHGFVVRYGEDLWRRVAVAAEASTAVAGQTSKRSR